MRDVARRADFPLTVESAGTHDYHVGEKPDSRMHAAATARGIHMRSRGRQVASGDLAPGRYDLVVAMDHANLDALQRMAGRVANEPPSHLHLFSEVLDDRWPAEVPDPYYGGDEGFEFVLDMLSAGCPRWLERLDHSPADDSATR